MARPPFEAAYLRPRPDNTPTFDDAMENLYPTEIPYEPVDMVNHPPHYTSGNIEVIDFITDQKLSYCSGQVVKYVTRAGKKDPMKHIEDLQKAMFYLQREIQEVQESNG